MINEWLINVRLNDDLSKGLSPRDKDDIEEVMESCCHFITEQFLNLELKYRILGAETHD